MAEETFEHAEVEPRDDPSWADLRPLAEVEAMAQCWRIRLDERCEGGGGDMSESRRIPIEVNAIVECRMVRSDGTRERGRIVALGGGMATIEVENPRKRGPRKRILPLGGRVGTGCGGVAHYRVVQLADGTRVQYGVGGPTFLVKETG